MLGLRPCLNNDAHQSIQAAYNLATTGSIPASTSVPQNVGKSDEHGDDQIAEAEHKEAEVMGSNILHPTGLLKLAKAMSDTPQKLRTHQQMETVFFLTHMIAIELRKRGRAIARGGVSLMNDALSTIDDGKVVVPFWGDVVCDITGYKGLKIHIGTIFGIDFYMVPSMESFCPAWMCNASSEAADCNTVMKHLTIDLKINKSDIQAPETVVKRLLAKTPSCQSRTSNGDAEPAEEEAVKEAEPAKDVKGVITVKFDAYWLECDASGGPSPMCRPLCDGDAKSKSKIIEQHVAACKRKRITAGLVEGASDEQRCQKNPVKKAKISEAVKHILL